VTTATWWASSAARGSENGKHLDVGNCIVFELTDGRITDGREHFHDLYAWDEFWS
jgi:ketosteroid isomerase-like protein